jgi:hypothetical protein
MIFTGSVPVARVLIAHRASTHIRNATSRSFASFSFLALTSAILSNAACHSALICVATSTASGELRLQAVIPNIEISIIFNIQALTFLPLGGKT